ncbi:MAG TPA: GNAT family N-acetyltransferase [Kofleriaceae bacterium]|jgi:GNAT superfamily N-acetyltransferase
MRIASLDRDHLVDAAQALSAACPFDRADVVAEETLFGPAPILGLDASGRNTATGALASPAVFGAWIGDLLVGVAAICANRIRVLAVIPWARKQGVGSALLTACEDAARANGATTLRTLDQPGNYLAPGIDVRNTPTIAWLEKRGFARHGDERESVIIDVRDNPRVSRDRAEERADACRTKGYEIRRARPDEAELLHAVDAEFGGAWSFELVRSLGVAAKSTALPGSSLSSPPRSLGTSAARFVSATMQTPIPAAHVALRGGSYCAFAAHDGNNRGLGWFGPTGTWPAHRGNGLGEALFLACLVDVAQEHSRCEVAWIGPRAFYEKVAGIVEDRHFVVLARSL